MLGLNDKKDNIPPRPLYDLGECSICGWKGELKDLETDMDSEGWEYPDYEVHLCPKCNDGGCIDVYDVSRKQLAKLLYWEREYSNGLV